MTALLVIAALILAVAVGIAVLVVRGHRAVDSLVREHLLDRYIVTIDHGETFSGLLAKVDARTLVLRDVKVTSSDDAPVDGELVLRRDSIVYMQKP